MITNQPVITVGAILMALVVAGVGGAAVITGDLNFKEYVDSVAVVAAGLGLGSGIARGLQARGGSSDVS